MDVVLLKDVEKLGAEGSVVHVKPGFARNFLLPRGLAVAATPSQVKTAQEITRQRRRKLERIEADAQTLKQRIEQYNPSFTLNLGEDGKAFGSITARDIADALISGGFAVEKHAVHLAQPIKTLGAHDVSVKLHPNVTAVLKLHVVKA